MASSRQPSEDLSLPAESPHSWLGPMPPTLGAYSPGGLHRESSSIPGAKPELRRTTTLGREKKLEKAAWLRSRFEAASLEKLQARSASAPRSARWCGQASASAGQRADMHSYCTDAGHSQPINPRAGLDHTTEQLRLYLVA